MALIGITGNIGSGKDTVAKMIQYYFYCKSRYANPLYTIEIHLKSWNVGSEFYMYMDWQIKKFAYKLKQIAAILVGCKAEDFESEEFKNQVLSDEWQERLGDAPRFTSRTNRWLLQTLGTEAIRNNIHKDTWVNALFCDYRPLNPELRSDIGGALDYSKCTYPNWIISDVRFLNEAKSIKDRNGIIIKVLRYESNDAHSSETELSQIKPDFTIYNYTTIENLYDGVKDCMKFFGY